MSFVHIHAHSEFSALDGLATCEEMAQRAAADGNPALAVTDHGNCAGHPDFQKACDAAGIKPIFGMESYFVPERTERPASGDKEAQARLRRNRHLVLLAMDDQGLHDLWALSTEAFRTGFYHRPRCDWELLERYGGHLIATTSCLGGIISKDLLEWRADEAIATVERMHQIFGDRLYLEVQSNALPQQVQLNKILAEIADASGIPLVAAADAHFTSPDKAPLHKLWMTCGTSPANDDYWHYVHMHSEDEVRKSLSYLGLPAEQAVASAAEIGDRCSARMSGFAEPPVFTPGGTADDDARLLLDLCAQAWDTRPRTGGSEQEYLDRLEREWKLVADKKLAGCYLIVHDYCRFCREHGILIGPGRGSAAGSLMSYLLGITAIDPIPARLLFERFLTDGRMALPDFDMDTPSSQRPAVQSYVIGKYGEDRVVRVGTNMRYRSKAILNKLFGILHDDPEAFADKRAVAGIIDEAESHTAGLGMPWPELMEQHEDELAPWVQKYPPLFEAAGQLVGRLNSYGRHPAGLVISTAADLSGQLPMRTASADDLTLVSQWDYRALEDMGLLKLDSLTLRTLDSIHLALRLIRQRWGVTLDPFNWSEEYADPAVWDEIATGNTLGMFQVETSLGQQTCRRMKPRSLSDLAAVITLVRPGPRNSGMAEAYLRRRAGREEVDYPHPLLEEALKPQYGAMLYQEDILVACRLLAGYSSAEADEVRKILGKKLREKLDAAGVKFIRRCGEHIGLPAERAADIWARMEKYGSYAFNRAHAYCYAMLSYWTAWLKVSYPVEMLAAILSTLGDDKDRIPEFVTDARRLGVAVLPPDVNAHASGFQPERLGIRYGLDAIKGVGPAAVAAVSRGQPYASYDDFAKRSGADKGLLWALARAGALDSLVPSRRGLVAALEADRSGASVTCVHKDETVTGPGGLPCTFDWASEPVLVRIGARGQELKSKPRPLPRNCTRACRNYTPPELTDMGAYAPYTARQLWAVENEIYGTWLTGAQFTALDPGLREAAREAALALPSVGPGFYPVVAVADTLDEARMRRGGTMFWLRLATEVSNISVAVFRPRTPDDPDFLPLLRAIPSGTLVDADLEKVRYHLNGTWRTSWRLHSIMPLETG